MKRIIKWIAIVIAVLIVVAFALPFIIDVNIFRPRIEAELTNALGRKVTVGNLKLSLLSGSLAANNITIADDPAFSNAPFVKAEALNVGVNMFPLILSKRLEIRDITLARPQVSLLRSSGGKWNFSTLGSTTAEAGTQPSGTSAAQSGSAQSKKGEQKPAPSKPLQNQPASQNSGSSPGNKTQSEQGLEQNLSDRSRSPTAEPPRDRAFTETSMSHSRIFRSPRSFLLRSRPICREAATPSWTGPLAQSIAVTRP